ncbi:MAG: AarF/ABC1/UbiB kinase family protein [Deltaproteobacteria bacterium]|nr:AarF/ABC1/UbiB kinase family protein [Deltaproteobacteria bacterium]
MLSIRQIGVLGRTYRNFSRYRQILSILFRYGFDDLVERLKIDQYIEIGLQMISRHKRENVEKLTRAERLRLLFEELGPTFIKFAQILSTRPDVIPADVISELEKLQDEVPPFSYAEAKEIIEAELGDNIETFFSSFGETPLASASIAQVHKAVLNDGTVVAVKVQRPGIKNIIEIDLEIMLHLATLMEKNIEEVSFQKPTRVIEEFARTIERELDFGTEAASMERVSTQFLDDRTIYIPKVYSDYSGTRVLTMDYVDGIKVSEVEKLEAAGLDLETITFRGANFIMKQVFEFGFFHADPHPGNVFVLPDNVICILDFGMTGSVDKNTKALFVDILESIARKDAEQCARLMLKLGEYDEEPDLRLLEKEIDDFMGKHLFKSLKEVDLARMLQDLLEIASHNRIRIPPVIFLMIKAFAALEGIARLLDPEFDIIAHAQPFVKRAKLARYSPGRLAENLFTTVYDSLNVLQELPREMLQLTKLIRQNKMTINMEMRWIDTFLRDLDQASNRLSFSIIIAALIIGSAFLLAYSTPPLVYGISLVGMLGFSAAAVLGIWLLIAILKKGML